MNDQNFTNKSHSSFFCKHASSKKDRATAPSLCSCNSFLWFRCFAWVCWRLQFKIKVSSASLTLHSFARTQARKKIGVTAPSLCSDNSFLWFGCFAGVCWCLRCMIKISQTSLTLHSFASTQARKKIGQQHLASAATTPSCGSAALLGSAGACDEWSKFHKQVSLFILLQARKLEKKLGPQHLASAAATPSWGTAALFGSAGACNSRSNVISKSHSSFFCKHASSKKDRATAPSLCSCNSFLWFRCFAWVCWRLQFKIKCHQQVSLFILSQGRKHEKKIGQQHLASAATTPSCGSAALLGSAGACDAWSKFDNQVSIFNLSQARKHENKLGPQHLASAAATPSCGTAALLGSSGACNA